MSSPPSPSPDTARAGAGADAAKASAALSALDARSSADDDENGTKASSGATEALGKAMRNLVVDGANEEARKVKIDGEDVRLLMHELEVSKARATELLRACDGDATTALERYICAPV